VTPIAVLDTSVAIDLYRGGLLDAFFKLPAKYMVPEILYEDELKDWFGEVLMANGLIIEQLDETEVAKAREFLRRCRSLSLVDAYALALAVRGKHTILAGAKDIRELGEEAGLEVRGVLHVFDLVEQAQLLSPAGLHTCLATMCKSRRVRLPREEVDARFAKYSSVAWPKNV
jgi:predicted nucleic acid-binding protein